MSIEMHLSSCGRAQGYPTTPGCLWYMLHCCMYHVHCIVTLPIMDGDMLGPAYLRALHLQHHRTFDDATGCSVDIFRQAWSSQLHRLQPSKVVGCTARGGQIGL
jgi:hypothetical protein